MESARRDHGTERASRDHGVERARRDHRVQRASPQLVTGDSAPVRVVAAVVERDGRYLVGRRPADKRHGGLWEFPGGKLESGETLFEAARRELSEELSVRCVGHGRTLWAAHDPQSIFLIEFIEIHIEGDARAVEHDAIGWFTPSELASMRLAPSDRLFAERLATLLR